MKSAGQSLPNLSHSSVEFADLPGEEEKQNERKERESIDRQISLWRKSNIPLRHKDGIDEFLKSQGPWIGVYEEIAAKLGTGFIFVLGGIRGVGKTQIASALIKKSCKMGLSASYRKAINFFLDFRTTFRKDSEYSEHDVLNSFFSPSLLVLDAIEERGETAFEDRVLSHLIDMRYDALKDTILITNQTKEAFSESAGNSIVSRIMETGGFIECAWSSFRSKK